MCVEEEEEEEEEEGGFYLDSVLKTVFPDHLSLQFTKVIVHLDSNQLLCLREQVSLCTSNPFKRNKAPVSLIYYKYPLYQRHTTKIFTSIQAASKNRKKKQTYSIKNSTQTRSNIQDNLARTPLTLQQDLEQELQLNNRGRMRDEIQWLRVLGPALLTIVSGEFSLIAKVVDVVFGVEEAVYVYYIVLCISSKLRFWGR